MRPSLLNGSKKVPSLQKKSQVQPETSDNLLLKKAKLKVDLAGKSGNGTGKDTLILMVSCGFAKARRERSHYNK